MQFSDLFTNGFSLLETKQRKGRKSIEENEVSIWYSRGKNGAINAGITFGQKDYLHGVQSCDILCANDGNKRAIIRFYKDKSGRTGNITCTTGSHGGDRETFYVNGVKMAQEVIQCLGIPFDPEEKIYELVSFTKIQEDIYLLTPKNS